MKSTMGMVWHIFKKDVRLLWLFVIGAAGIQFVSAGLMYLRDHLASANPALVNLSRLLAMATIPASALLIVAVVQQDAVPGARQDWLVRPVRRRDLLLAKLCFVLVMAHGPILLADTLQGLVNGFPLMQSLAAAASRCLYLFLGVNLPLLAFASLTRNMTQAVIAGVSVFLAFAVVGWGLFYGRMHDWPTEATGLLWMAQSTICAVLVLGAVVILAVQYFRRKTRLAWWLTGGIFCLGFLAPFVPWQFAFALEQRLSPNPGAGSPVELVFEPSVARFRLPVAMSQSTGEGTRSNVALITYFRKEASAAYLPIYVTGLGDGAVLNTDRAQVRLVASDGRIVYSGAGDDLLLRKESSAEPVHFTIGLRRSNLWRDIAPEDLSLTERSTVKGGEVLVYQGVAMQRSLFDQIKNQTLRLEIDYSLTLLRSTSYAMPALDGDMQMPGVGRCKTQMDNDGDDIQFRCIQAGATLSNCSSAFLEHTPSGRRNPVKFICSPDYAPYFGQYIPDAMLRFGTSFPFRDISGLAKYPVDVAQLPESRVVMRAYRRLDHFTRRLVIPEIRLSDWEAVEK